MIRYHRRSGMDLLTLLEDHYFKENSNITSEVTKRRYRRAVTWLGEAVRHAPTTADFCDQNLAAVVAHLRETRRQQNRTINGTLECLRAFWRWARDSGQGKIERGPTVKPLKVQERPPKAWRRDELERLVRAADAQKGSICGMPASIWWLTLLTIALDTGARITEMLSMRWEWIDWHEGTVSVDASVRKGGQKFMAYRLRAISINWLQEHRQTSGLILPWDMDPSRLYQLYKKILLSAGLPATRETSFHCLRKTFLTEIDANGGDATKAAGHSSRATTIKHYIDPTRSTTVHADVIPFHPLRMIEQREAATG
jgi:integrase